MLFSWEYLFPNDWAAIIRENFDKQPWNENSERFATLDTLAREASGVSGTDWRGQTRLKKNIITSLELLRVFSGMEIHLKHSSL